MRNISFISTKDHLLYVVLADTIGDELTAADINMVNSSNGGGTFVHSGIGFGIDGSANTFYYKNSSWEYHGECIAPYLSTQYNANSSTSYLFGAVATISDTLYIGVIPKESSVESSLINITQEVANTSEINNLQQSTNTAFQLFKICRASERRDLNTFESLAIIPPNIEDSDIEII
jgi:hypothetical protein